MASQTNEQMVMELQRLREAEEARQASSEQTKKRIVVGLLLAVLALVGLWSTGRMDPWLSGIGLNKNTCYKNGFGATFCGDDATAYQRQLDQIGLGSAESSTSHEANAAQANVRSAIPAIEAYYADHGSYAGISTAAVQAIDYGITNLVVGASTPETYCAQSTVGTETYSVRGPGGDILPGSC